jgi:hypothetical protein
LVDISLFFKQYGRGTHFQLLRALLFSAAERRDKSLELVFVSLFSSAKTRDTRELFRCFCSFCGLNNSEPFRIPRGWQANRVS